MPTLAVAEAAASAVAAADFTGAGSVAVAACTPDVSTVAAIVVGCVLHIPSPAARLVPDIPLPVVPVVRATRSRAEGIIADTDTDTARRQWELQRPTAPMVLRTTVTMRTAIGSVPISINIDTCRAHADRRLGPVLTAVPFSYLSS
jgi:hypothetical protein